jgi:hypothetical protein
LSPPPPHARTEPSLSQRPEMSSTHINAGLCHGVQISAQLIINK